MSENIGELLPLALGVAISPIPVIAVIVMLLSARAGVASGGFLFGWVTGIAAATTAFERLSVTVGLDAVVGGSSLFESLVKTALGVLLAVLGVRQWRSRPQAGEETPLPKWLAAVNELTLGKAWLMGFVLSALNPKNLAMCIAAGIAIAQQTLPPGLQITAIAVFTVIAASTVALPVIVYMCFAERMRPRLERIRAWLRRENTTVMSVLFLFIAALLIGDGLGGLL